MPTIRDWQNKTFENLKDECRRLQIPHRAEFKAVLVARLIKREIEALRSYRDELMDEFDPKTDPNEDRAARLDKIIKERVTAGANQIYDAWKTLHDTQLFGRDFE